MTVYSEYTGLTAEVASLIEKHRLVPGETKCDILKRVLSPIVDANAGPGLASLDLGQGVIVHEGEQLLLFLSRESIVANKPDGVAVVGKDGLYVDDEKVKPSKGSLITPAMRIFQKRLNHRNPKGEIISLNAYEKWHLEMGDKYVCLDDLKDPALVRKRGAFKKLMNIELDL